MSKLTNKERLILIEERFIKGEMSEEISKELKKKYSIRKKLTKKRKILLITMIVSIVVVSTIIVIFAVDKTAHLPSLNVGDEWWYRGHYYDNYVGYEYDIYCFTRINGTGNIKLIDTYEEITRYYDEYGMIESRYYDLDKSTLNPIDSKGNTLSKRFNFPLKDGKTWEGKWRGYKNRTFKAEYVEGCKVPAGTYNAYRIKVLNDTKLNAEYYYSDDVRGICKVKGHR
jgi:hypothetical protein